MIPCRAFASLSARADQDRVLVEVVTGRFDGVVDVAAGGSAEADQELDQQRHRIGLGVRRGAGHELAGDAVQRGVARGRRPVLIARPHSTVELQLADAAVRERELFAQRGVLLTLTLVLVKRGTQPGTQRRVAGALADRETRRRGAVRRAQRLDLGAQLGVLVEEHAADPGAFRDRSERDRRAVCIELAQRGAHPLLGVERALGGGVGQRTRGGLG